MAKSVIGYAAASLGSRIDVENTTTRAVLTFGFSLLQSVLLYLIERRLLGIRELPSALAARVASRRREHRWWPSRSSCCSTAPSARSSGRQGAAPPMLMSEAA